MSFDIPFKIYLLVYRFHHHSSASGYNRLADFIPCTEIAIPRAVGTILKSTATPSVRERLLESTGLTGYFPECRWLEWATGFLSKLPRNSIFHFIYPENSYHFAATYKRSRKAKLVATYHQPVKESREFIRKLDAIRRLDGVLLMSESQREFFEPLLGPERLFVVHYGVDLSYFRPAPTLSPEERFIVVGNWLRDFTTLSAALEILSERRPSVKCDVVSHEANRELFKEHTNVRFHSGIADKELLRLYHLSRFSVMPLAGAAANTAVLESLACGLPLVITDLPATREYTTPKGARYVRHKDPEELAEAIIERLEDPEGTGRMRDANLELAKYYSWENVAERTMNAYRKINAL